ncbi:MAG: helix-turn-helix domain-containing protein [Haloechinothrix sp.]
MRARPVATRGPRQNEQIAAELQSRHFGRVMAAYRLAHDPPISQRTLGGWLGMTQAQVSRLENARVAPANLVKLQRWAAALNVPPALLWFAAAHTREESTPSLIADIVDDVHRRDMLKLTGAAAVAGSGILNDAPWRKLSESLAGRRAADASTVTMIEVRTSAFFRTEETQPARQLITSLKAHHRALRGLIDATTNESLRRRLITAAGETEALAGWTLFDLQRPRDAVRLYRSALESAREAGDNPLAACVFGFWSYLHSAQGNALEAARMLDSASDYVKGSAAATHAWVTARRAEEQASAGDANGALRSLDSAVTVFDYANPMAERPWTCFFTPSRLGSLAVSTYGRMAHPDTDRAAADLLASLTPTENKVKAIVLADLATTAARAGDIDRMQTLTDVSAPLAVRTESSVAMDRLWDLVELIPEQNGTAGRSRARLTEQLLSGQARS